MRRMTRSVPLPSQMAAAACDIASRADAYSAGLPLSWRPRSRSAPVACTASAIGAWFSARIVTTAGRPSAQRPQAAVPPAPMAQSARAINSAIRAVCTCKLACASLAHAASTALRCGFASPDHHVQFQIRSAQPTYSIKSLAGLIAWVASAHEDQHACNSAPRAAQRGRPQLREFRPHQRKAGPKQSLAMRGQTIAIELVLWTCAVLVEEHVAAVRASEIVDGQDPIRNMRHRIFPDSIKRVMIDNHPVEAPRA